MNFPKLWPAIYIAKLRDRTSIVRRGRGRLAKKRRSKASWAEARLCNVRFGKSRLWRPLIPAYSFWERRVPEKSWSLERQPKLLRVLQEHEFERLGSTHTQQVDVRVVAATHRDLKQMVQDGAFRSDLYYRLHVFPLSVPPLRERREDIAILVRHFVDEYARRMNRRIETIPPQAIEALTNYSWPGNVRELQNF